MTNKATNIGVAGIRAKIAELKEREKKVKEEGIQKVGKYILKNLDRLSADLRIDVEMISNGGVPEKAEQKPAGAKA